MNRNKIMKNQAVKNLMKKGAVLSLCAVLAAGSIGGMSASAAQDGVFLLKNESESTENTERIRGGLDVSDIVEKAMPSVVSITTKSVMEVNNYYGRYGFGYGYFPETTEREIEGSGSGIIIGENETELLIATNYHVVEDANEVTVTFADGESYETKGKGFDEDRDLAVVAVQLEDLTEDTLDAIQVAKIGSSDDLKVGEQVIAIGNALGYGQSVTTGIVSAKNRKLDNTSEDAVDLIQTDAAINPGNSGGALLNMNGEVVGINSAKMASTEVEGMGYAISISTVADVLEKLMNEVPREKVEGSHGVLGITGSTVSEEARYYGIPQGVHVAEVNEGGAADKAGIKKNFVITEFDGKDINTIERLVELLEYYAPGEEVEVVVEYPDAGEYVKKTITVVLGEDSSKKEEKEEKKEKKRAEEKVEEPEEEEPDEEEADGYPSMDDLEEYFFGNLFGDGEGRDGGSVYEDGEEEEDGGNFWN